MKNIINKLKTLRRVLTSLLSMNVYKIIGIIITGIGIIFNELTIKIITGYETKFNTIEKSIFLFIIQVIIISIGIYVIKKGKSALQNLFLLFGSILFFLILLEIILSFSIFQNLSSSNPVWIPAKYKKNTSKLIYDHYMSSSKNYYGFNDKNHSFEKENKYRIAILGDSFIWGYGVTDSVLWINKLEKYFQSDSIDCSVMKWGKSGWSTLDQFNFLKGEGIKFNFDYLIFSFVVNDPDQGNIYLKKFIHEGGFADKKIIQPLSIFFPNSISFIKDLIENFLAANFGYGYHNWLNKEVYTENNLSEYSLLLNRIKEYCERRDIKYLFVLTPENHSPVLENYFKMIEEIMMRNKIHYFNLFPVVKEELKDYSVRELWANPADGHPGDLVTGVLAKHIYEYLLSDFFI